MSNLQGNEFACIEFVSPELLRMMEISYRARARWWLHLHTQKAVVWLTAAVIILTTALAVGLGIGACLQPALLCAPALGMAATALFATLVLLGIHDSRHCWFAPRVVTYGPEKHSAAVIVGDTRARMLAALRKQITAWNQDVSLLNTLVALQGAGAELSSQEAAMLRDARQRWDTLCVRIQYAEYLCSLALLGEYRERVHGAPEQLVASYLPLDGRVHTGLTAVPSKALYDQVQAWELIKDDDDQ